MFLCCLLIQICCSAKSPQGHHALVCLVRLKSCNEALKASRLLGINALDGSLFHSAIELVKEAVFVVVVGGGYLSVFTWVDGSCLVVSELEILVGVNV